MNHRYLMLLFCIFLFSFVACSEKIAPPPTDVHEPALSQTEQPSLPEHGQKVYDFPESFIQKRLYHFEDYKKFEDHLLSLSYGVTRYVRGTTEPSSVYNYSRPALEVTLIRFNSTPAIRQWFLIKSPNPNQVYLPAPDGEYYEHELTDMDCVNKSYLSSNTEQLHFQCRRNNLLLTFDMTVPGESAEWVQAQEVRFETLKNNFLAELDQTLGITA